MINIIFNYGLWILNPQRMQELDSISANRPPLMHIIIMLVVHEQLIVLRVVGQRNNNDLSPA
jgi:hypothetical protein